MHGSSVRAVMLSLAVMGLAPAAAGAQEATGRIVGRIVDTEQGAPIAGAQIQLVESGAVTLSALDGRYTIQNVPIGVASIRVRTIGYAPKLITGIAVKTGVPTLQEVALATAVVEVEEIVVTSDAERGTVNQALDEQRGATNIVSSVSAEAIRRSPDSDAGQAVQRVSGASVQDGKYVFVRGLGERYTTTSLNGARIPSPEPERKVVPLDLFPAGLLEGITTSKTFTPDQPGDFSGAAVNLKTREFPAGRVISFTTSAGMNAAATGRDIIRAPATGGDWLGFGARNREIPGGLVAAGNLGGTSQTDRAAFINSFRNVWNGRRSTGSANGGFGATIGGEDPAFGQMVGYIGSLTYSYGQEIRSGEERAVAFPSAIQGDVEPQNAYLGSTGRNSVLWGGILNLSTRIGASSKLSFNNSYNRSADNEASRIAGFNEQLNQSLDITRLTYVERSVRANQLQGEHLLGENTLVNWSGSVSAVSRDEPDRSDLAYIVAVDPTSGAAVPSAWFGAPRSATRTFSSVDEDALEGSANITRYLGRGATAPVLKIGMLGRKADRDADSRAYEIYNVGLTEAERQATPAEIFGGQYAADGRLELFANNLTGRYTAADRLVAGYGQFELSLSDRIRLIGGARVERSKIEVSTFSIVTGQDTVARLSDTDVLPSLAMNVGLSDDQNIRFSASQTLARPEYRELSPVTYFDILGGQKLFGYTGLERSLIQNYDARWEWYPNAGEVVSVALFGKRFRRPIERILVQNADGAVPDITFRNAESAFNYGVELELRKELGGLAGALAPFTVFANATLMQSEIKPGNDSLSSLTNAARPMAGQSEYVVNAGLSYSAADGRLNATVLYNVAGERITEAGIFPLPDTYERARHLLDASLQAPLGRSISLKLDGRNLLDAPYRLMQGDVTRLRYRSGRVFSLGLTWTP